MTISPGVDVFDVRGKRVFVTGASRGIGQAIAVGLAKRGAQVVGAARSQKGLVETEALTHGSSGTFHPYVVDLRSERAIKTCVEHVAQQLGGLDVLVSNAADDHHSSIEDTDLGTYQRVLDLNLQSCWLLLRESAPWLRASRGNVINVASVHGLVAHRDNSAYVVAKHGLVGLTKAAALEWAENGVRVNALCPGYVQTAMLPDLDVDELASSRIRFLTPMGRWSQPEEYVGPVVFLASEASSFMTGQTLVVDGGLTAR